MWILSAGPLTAPSPGLATLTSPSAPWVNTSKTSTETTSSLIPSLCLCWGNARQSIHLKVCNLSSLETLRHGDALCSSFFSCIRGQHSSRGGRGSLADREGPRRRVDQVSVSQIPMRTRTKPQHVSHFRVRRLNVSHLDPMPEGFVPTSYIETTEMFDQPQPV